MELIIGGSYNSSMTEISNQQQSHHFSTNTFKLIYCKLKICVQSTQQTLEN